MVRVKICGITSLEEALAVAFSGADALGFVFARSRRGIHPEAARRIARELPPAVSKVGVFVNPRREDVSEIAEYCGLDLLQFHGEEPPEFCLGWRQPVIKAFRVHDRSFLKQLASYQVSAYLLDSCLPGRRGGTGVSFNWELARDVSSSGRVILAGGLTAENVGEAVGIVKPFAVDVSSGVETGGKKDLEKIRSFLAAVRRNDDGTA